MFEVPTDWTIHIVYNIGLYAGEANLISYVIPYTDQDIGKLQTIWQPTKTTYEPAWIAQREKDQEMLSDEAAQRRHTANLKMQNQIYKNQ